MGDWPECTFEGEGEGDGGEAASTLEQLKGATEGGDGDGDGSSPGASFTDDFVGTEVRKNCFLLRKVLRFSETFGRDKTGGKRWGGW